ncbi:MAG: hypothetical protein KatS3mg076_2633 [Candidatus Binatia bacterium]|nr:MAG: hypothetical protein KatS3mg076_2633 [Candidatus Binatia bacterium]
MSRYVKAFFRKAFLARISLLAFLVTFPAAARAVSCGDTITGSVTLVQSDSIVNEECETEPALTVVGPARVDLGGFSIRCKDGGNDGIVVVGIAASIQSGEVTGCDRGVVLTSTGAGTRNVRHRVVGVVSSSNQAGFWVQDANKLRVEHCVAKSNAGPGFGQDQGFNQMGSRYTSNLALDNGGQGFDFMGGLSSSVMRRNVATGNGGDGFLWLGKKNRWTENIASRNTGDGFRTKLDPSSGPLFGSTGSRDLRFSRNMSVGNGGDGFELGGDDAKRGGARVYRNVFAENGKTGLDLQESNVGVVRNVMVGNQQAGIQVDAGESENRIRNNFSLVNDGTDVVDLNPDCGSNRWKNDTFRSSDVAAGGENGCLDQPVGPVGPRSVRCSENPSPRCEAHAPEPEDEQHKPHASQRGHRCCPRADAGSNAPSEDERATFSVACEDLQGAQIPREVVVALPARVLVDVGIVETRERSLARRSERGALVLAPGLYLEARQERRKPVVCSRLTRVVAARNRAT